MDYEYMRDMISVRKMLGLSQTDIAKELGVETATISRIELGKEIPSHRLLEQFYTYTFNRGIRINILKEMFWRETICNQSILLFHGAKNSIKGNIRIDAGRPNNDLGKGFYAGERYDQAVSFISGYSDPSVYVMEFRSDGLISKHYEVDQDWMMTIAYYKGALDSYSEHPIIKGLVESSKNFDYLVAPIADNRMFQIIDSFTSGEITDIQCKHCLAATNLGLQYVFTSNKAVERIKILERCFISDAEKDYNKRVRSNDARIGSDKVKLARINYRGQGKYIDEILV